MLIKVTKSVVHLGFGYRIGFTGDVPDEVGRKLLQMERAVLLPSPEVEKVKAKVEEIIEPIEEEPKVHKAVIKKTRKRK